MTEKEKIRLLMRDTEDISVLSLDRIVRILQSE